jgi:hypothetical protein
LKRIIEHPDGTTKNLSRRAVLKNIEEASDGG